MLPRNNQGGAASFWATLPRPIVGLAPMDGITDQPCRHIQKKYGNPALVYTEFTSVEALCHGDWLSVRNLLYDESQRPIIGQIYGRTPRYFEQVAVLLCELGFDGIDINMGCPAKTVANGGSGAGLIRTPDLAQGIIQATKRGVEHWQNGATVADCPDLVRPLVAYVAKRREQLSMQAQERRVIPVSVKTRIGFETPVVDAWIPRLLEAEPTAIGVHGRTLRQAYTGQADWDEIGRAAQVAQGSGILILGNGDVTSRSDALRRAATYGVDGVLIGRASFGNPFVFQQPVAGTDPAEAPAQRPPRQTMIQIALEHAHLYEHTFRPLERYWFLPMRKHLGWYIKEVRGARPLRNQLMQVTNAQEVETLLQQQAERYAKFGGLYFD
jgi:nifR3 family TIM-barrel protein